MSSKSIILTSNGLKNIIIKNYKEEEFRIINGEEEIIIPRIYAEFLSPRISHMHRIDPTINQLDISELITTKTKNSKTTKILQNILNENTKQFINEIIEGKQANIEQQEERKLRYLSVILGNEELFKKLDKNTKNDENITEIIEDIIFYEEISNTFIDIEKTKMIDKISEHFSSKDQQEIKNLPRTIFYMIINNDKFKRPEEDFLFDIINEIINKTNEKDNNYNNNKHEINDNEMYELIDFKKLSDDKFKEFLQNFNFTEMTTTIWNKLCECFFISRSDKEKYKLSKNKNENENENSEQIEYDGNPNNRFTGIINHLRGGKSINIHDEGIISVTASSTFSFDYPKYAVDFDNDKYFHSDDKCGWIQYDFKNMKIRPTKYSIKTRNDNDSQCPMNWCIEVSNTGEENDWRILDSRENNQSVSKRNQNDTFTIQTQLTSSESYRYIRFRSTGNTSGGNSTFVISSLEYFGTLIKNE